MKPHTSWIALALLASLSGCANRSSVIAATATTIGVELGTQAANATPTGVLGYRRAEFAHVPTQAASSASGSIKDVPNVLMELSYGGTLTQNGRIYQRLAVGTEAVTHAGAALMFSRGAEGAADPQAVAALAKATLSAADKVTNCVVKDDKVSTARLSAIAARAEADDKVGAQIQSFRGLLGNLSKPADLRTLLQVNDGLVSGLAKHLSEADCQK